MTRSNWFVLTKSEDGVPLDSAKQLFTFTMVVLLVSNFVRFTVYNLLRSFYCQYCGYNGGNYLLDAFVDSVATIIFHIILLYILQMAYPDDENRANAYRETAYAAQLWILTDVLFLVNQGIYNLISRQPGYYGFESYWILWAAATVYSVIIIAKPIIERLKQSYQDYSKIVAAAITLSILIYWISYGLSWVAALLIFLPLGVY